MDSCDVLIVGGGPAGSSCAWGLRRSGANVLLLDKQDFPRDKVCGGWITPRVLAALEIDPEEYARGRVLQPITGFRVGHIAECGAKASAVEIDYGRAVSFGIRRREFDDYLLRRSGATLRLGAGLTSLRRKGDAWIANEQINDEIQARVVVGAGGHFCPVARLTGAKAANEPAVVAQETEFKLCPDQLARCRIRGDRPELYFCSDMKGYGWCFRKGAYLNVGLGRADPHGLTAHVAAFLQFLKTAGRISFEIPPLHGHAYLLHGTSTRAANKDGIVLIGDAAGLAHPQSGEGIWPAVESGLLAARSIVNQQMETYRSPSLIATRAPASAASIARLLPPTVAAFLGRNLLRTRWFVRDVVLNSWFLGTGVSQEVHSS